MKLPIQAMPVLLSVFLVTLSAAGAAFAQSGNSISFQGALTGPGGNPLSNGSYNLTFKFYTNSTTVAPIATSIVSNSPVTGGIISTAIPVQPQWFNGKNIYVGISIDGGLELSPRVLITAVPYALGFSGGQLKIGSASEFVLPDYQLQIAGARANILLQDSEDPTHGAFWTLESEAYSSGNFGILRWLTQTTAIPSLVIHEDGRRVGIGTRPQDFNGQSQLQIVGENADIMLQNTRGSGYWTIESDAYRQTGDFGLIYWNAGRPQPHFIVNTLGNVGLGTQRPQAKLDVQGTARMTVCQITSDRAAKEQFIPVSPRDILKQLVTVPISKWAYTNSPSTRHIGPVAQDFAAAFAVGEDDKHIATVDADGVALAAIQGLNELVEEKDAKIRSLEKRLDALERIIESRPVAP